MLKDDLNKLILQYGTNQIIEELAVMTLEAADYLQSHQFFNAEKDLRQQATKLYAVTSEKSNTGKLRQVETERNITL